MLSNIREFVYHPQDSLSEILPQLVGLQSIYLFDRIGVNSE